MKNHNFIRGIALVLMLVMTLSVFVACDKTEDPAPSTPETTKAPETTAEEHVHKYGDAVQTKAPTCTEFGEKTATCDCGKVVTSSVAPLGHKYENPQVLQAATCTEKGRQKGTCACGATEEKDIDALGHDYKDKKCTRCNKDEPHAHTFNNNVCTICNGKAFDNQKLVHGLTNTVEKTSSFDGDKNGTNDKFYFSPTLASDFANAIYVKSGDYDKELSNKPTSNTKDYAVPHYYTTEKTDQTLVYKINVTEAGVYEMVFCLRLKDTKERGNNFTINPDKATEYSFEASFKPASSDEIATMAGVDKVNGVENIADTSYMYGIQIALSEGENIIEISTTTTEKCPHYRGFYFLKVA